MTKKCYRWTDRKTDGQRRQTESDVLIGDSKITCRNHPCEISKNHFQQFEDYFNDILYRNQLLCDFNIQLN